VAGTAATVDAALRRPERVSNVVRRFGALVLYPPAAVTRVE